MKAWLFLIALVMLLVGSLYIMEPEPVKKQGVQENTYGKEELPDPWFFILLSSVPVSIIYVYMKEKQQE